MNHLNEHVKKILTRLDLPVGPDEGFTLHSLRRLFRTARKTELKDTHKQQLQRPAVAADSLEAFQLLRDAGFDEQTAAALSQRKPASEIEQQIRWLPLRNVRKNQLGLLRRAIEENWAKPSARPLARTAKPQDRSEHNDDDQEKRRRLEQRDALARQWQALDEQERGRFYEQLVAVGQKITSLGHTEKQSADELIESAEQEFLQVARQSSGNEPTSLYARNAVLREGEAPAEPRAAERFAAQRELRPPKIRIYRGRPHWFLISLGV